MKTIAILTATTVMALSSVAHATSFLDRSSFNAAAGPLVTERFESCGTSTIGVGNDVAVSATSGPCSAIAPGISFAPDAGFDLYIAGPGQSANVDTALGVDFPLGGHNNISFMTPTEAFGADFFQNFGGGAQSGTPTLFLIETFLGGIQTASFSFNVDSGTGSFFGLTSSPFDSLQVSQGGFGVGTGYAVLDNVSFGQGTMAAVPEPTTWALFVLGFGAIGGAMRARTRKSITSRLALRLA